jgi:hypothetical protein
LHDATLAMPAIYPFRVTPLLDRLSAFSYIFQVLITASCHACVLKLTPLREPDMQPDACAAIKPDTSLCALTAPVSPVFACRPQLSLAPTLNVTFKSLDIFCLRSKLRSTVTSGMPGIF